MDAQWRPNKPETEEFEVADPWNIRFHVQHFAGGLESLYLNTPFSAA